MCVSKIEKHTHSDASRQVDQGMYILNLSGMIHSQARHKHLIFHYPSEERGVLEVGSIPVAIIPSCQYMKTIAL